MTKRTELDILVDILKATEKPVRITEIMMKANTNYVQSLVYIERLKDLEMLKIQPNPRKYYSTSNGKLFVKIVTSKSSEKQ